MDTFGCYPGIFSGDIVKMAEGKRWKKLMTGLARLGKVARGGGHIPPVGETERGEMDFVQSDFV